MHACIHTYVHTYIHIPATSTCAKLLPLKIKKNVPGSIFEQEKCTWKIIPKSYPSSFIPSCDSNATTVGYCWCLLLAPNQRLKSMNDMPVWDEQVARMIWNRAKAAWDILRQEHPWSQKHGPSVKKIRTGTLNLIMCVACAHGLSPVSYLEHLQFWNWKWVSFPNYRNHAFYPATFRPLQA